MLVPGAPVSAEVFDAEAALERLREQDRGGGTDDAEYSLALSGALAVPILREAREAGLLVPHGDGYTVPRAASPAIAALLEGMQEVGSLVEVPRQTPEARGGQ